MAMGKKRARQQDLWIATDELPRSRGHIFYDWVNQILNVAGFDEFAEKECIRFYKSETMGRPSIAPFAAPKSECRYPRDDPQSRKQRYVIDGALWEGCIIYRMTYDPFVPGPFTVDERSMHA